MTRRESRFHVITRLAEIARIRAARRCAGATARARTARELAQRSARLAVASAQSLRIGVPDAGRALRVADARVIEARDCLGVRRLNRATQSAISEAEVARACEELRGRAVKELASLTHQRNGQRRLRDADLARVERERRRKRERHVAECALDLWASQRALEGDRDDD